MTSLFSGFFSFCEIMFIIGFLFREGEVLLLVVRAEIRVLSSPSLFWPGLCVVTNKRIHLLRLANPTFANISSAPFSFHRIISPETEEPSEWLEVKDLLID